MDRRDFIAGATGVLAAGVLTGCASRGAGRAPRSPAAGAGTPMNAAAFHAARRIVDTRFGNVAYVERGTGDGALFLHGFPLNGFQWRGALDRLSLHRRCIAPDFLGLGYTEVSDGQSVALDAQVAMLVELMDVLEIPSVDVVANDSGGAVAQWLAVRHPRRVRSLLLTNCDAEPDCPPAALLPVIELARQGRFVSEWLAPWLADKALARSPDGLAGMTYTYPENVDDETIEIYLAPGAARARAGKNACLRTGARSECPGGYRVRARPLSDTGPYRLGHRRHHLLAGQPGLPRSLLRQLAGRATRAGRKAVLPRGVPRPDCR
ncbi:MAG: alpha/beta fold hydrolase [Longimicrobiales bacterium]